MAKTSYFRFKQFDTIGNTSAESDQIFLAESFLDTGALQIVSDTTDARSIVLGRTGTGKTALLDRLENSEERVARIDPHTIALSYISNSTVFRFFEAAGVEMDPFYRFLWKHVFVTEVLRMRFESQGNNGRSNRVADLINNLLRKKSHKEAFEYLESWGANYIANTEDRIREVTTKIEEDLMANISAGVSGHIRLGAEGALHLSEEMKSEIHHRGQDVLNTLQISKLNSLFEALDEDLLDDRKKHYYVVVDRLDEQWVTDGMRFRLIRSLIEVMREMNSKVAPVKVVIALRVDLFETVLKATSDAGFQAEKYRALCLELKWKKAELIKLVDLRIGQLVRSRWTAQPITYVDIFQGTVGRRKEKPLDYMIDRTLMRPRDIISFVNECIGLVANEGSIHPKIIDRAEPKYSEMRLKSLADEWSIEYPLLFDVCCLLKKKASTFELQEVTDDELDQLSLHLFDKIESNCTRDAHALHQYLEGQVDASRVRAVLASILYKVGAIGLKPESYNQLSWTYESTFEISAGQLDDDSKIYPHKMLWRGLGIKGSA